MAARPRQSFAQRRKLALSDFRQQVIEAQSQLSSIFLEMPNGEEYEIPHPMLISDEAQKRLEVVQSGQDYDKDEAGNLVEPLRIGGQAPEPLAIRTARALLGDEDHKRFVAAGGHSNDITLAWQMLVREHKEVADADPK
jgi:hypothetical protein